jgi:pyruvate dehydrogenase E1 component alpha subunit
MEGHSTSDDPRVYRPAELVEPWRKKDPILRLRAFLQERGLLSADEEPRLAAEVKEEILAALRKAESFPPKPPLETLFDGVYAEPSWQQREQLAEVKAAIEADPRVTGAKR